ncbi:AAA FAMILY ATPASE [Helicobacter bizzozeronii CCUG 35545]|nr:AAA FAMILY ATPASE [Helicobacter bizzozeronii CCUG 35545]
MTLPYFVDFIQAKDVRQARIFYALKCHTQEALILQYMAQEYLKGHGDIEVVSLLDMLFAARQIEALPYLQHIKNLLDLEWIVLEKRSRRSEVLLLELLESSIALSTSFF